MTDKEAMAMALEALECANSPNGDYENEIAALKERLAQPEQEPVAWAMDYDIESVLSGFSTSLMGTAMRIESAFPKHRVKLLYTTPPQRTWVGLTDEEILSDDTLRYYYGMNGGAGPVSQKGKKVIAAIEAKLKQKNGYAEEKNT
jgi:hypothetical protein